MRQRKKLAASESKQPELRRSARVSSEKRDKNKLLSSSSFKGALKKSPTSEQKESSDLKRSKIKFSMDVKESLPISNESKNSITLPSRDEENSEMDRKEVFRLGINQTESSSATNMPHLDREAHEDPIEKAVPEAAKEKSGSVITQIDSTVNSDDMPPHLTVAKVISSVAALTSAVNDSGDEFGNNNSSPPPLERYADEAKQASISLRSSESSPTSTSSHAELFDEVQSTSHCSTHQRATAQPLLACELASSVQNRSRKRAWNTMEPIWTDRMAQVLSELNPRQLMIAKERAFSIMVKFLAQEITADLSTLMGLIEGNDRRAVAFERVLSGLKRLKSDRV